MTSEITVRYDKDTQTCVSWIEDKKKYLEEHGHEEIVKNGESKIRKRIESSSNNLGRVKVKLMDLLQKREPPETIIKKGILRRRSVFGADLEEVVSREGRNDGVPLFVRKCISAIEAPNRIAREGIYRINGNAAQIQKLRLMVDDNVDYNLLDDNWDVHTLTGTFKLFFREMQFPLLPQEFYAKMKDLVVHQNLKDQNLVRNMQPAVETLITGFRRATLKALITHLLNVMKADNMMTAENLALVFGPNIMWQRNKDDQLESWSVEKVMIPTQVLQLFLKHPGLLEAKESTRLSNQSNLKRTSTTTTAMTMETTTSTTTTPKTTTTAK